jgi:hypothetical protein
MTAITTAQLTAATLEGDGVFDVLMKANQAHLDSEFQKGRIKGSEYATVYLGSLTQVMQTALQFLLSQQKTDLEAQLMTKQIALVTQQTANAVLEGTVLVAQECKLRAEYDLTMATILKTNQEIALLTQKTATERAQVTTLGVDEDSVLGRQKALYVAQTDGFKRDAEQKAAKVMIDTWNVRRTTDEGTVADGTNMLNDATVGRAVTKLLSGVGA